MPTANNPPTTINDLPDELWFKFFTPSLNELWFEIFSSQFNQAIPAKPDLNRLLQLRRISRRANHIIINNKGDTFYQTYLGQEFLETAKKYKIPCIVLLAKRYLKLRDIIDSKSLGINEWGNVVSLKNEGARNLSSAHLMVRYSRTQQFFLAEDRALEYITMVGLQHLSVAFFMINNGTFRQAFSKNKRSLGYLIQLIQAHEPIALSIFGEATELQDAITELQDAIMDHIDAMVMENANTSVFRNNDVINNISAIFKKHESTFILFFQNIKLKEKLLEILKKADAWTLNLFKSEFLDISRGYGILYEVSLSNPEREYWQDKDPVKLIEYIMHRLRVRRFILQTASNHPNKAFVRLRDFYKDTSNDPVATNLWYITQMGMSCRLLAHCIVSEFRQELLEHEMGLQCIIDLAKVHNSIACSIFKENKNIDLCGLIMNSDSAIEDILQIFETHESVFIAFFENIHSKESFLKRIQEANLSRRLKKRLQIIGKQYNVCCDNHEEECWLSTTSNYQKLIEHMLYRLTTRQSILEAVKSEDSNSAYSRLNELFQEKATDFYDNNFLYIAKMGIPYAPLAHFILTRFREALLKHERGLQCIIDLAKAHTSVALSIFKENENIELRHLIMKSASAIDSVLVIFEAHTLTFSEFFEDITLQNDFLQLLESLPIIRLPLIYKTLFGGIGIVQEKMQKDLSKEELMGYFREAFFKERKQSLDEDEVMNLRAPHP